MLLLCEVFGLVPFICGGWVLRAPVMRVICFAPVVGRVPLGVCGEFGLVPLMYGGFGWLLLLCVGFSLVPLLCERIWFVASFVYRI